jgi:UDP-N-acetylglucosamine 2-epimerase
MAEKHAEALWIGLKNSKPGTLIITKANADAEGTILNKKLESLMVLDPIENSKIFASLGHHRYLSLLKKSNVAVGNSSSLVIEAPILGTASVNIGRRQEGRVRCSSIIDVTFSDSEITSAIKNSLGIRKDEVIHPFGKPGVAKRIVKILNEGSLPEVLVKGFYE